MFTEEPLSAPARLAMTCFPLIEDFDDEPPHGAVPESAECQNEPQAVAAPGASEIEALRAQAYAEGRADERGAIATEQAAGLSHTLASLVEQLHHAGRDAAVVAEAAAEETARLLLRVMAAMMPSLCARHGAADVAALVRAVVPALVNEPSVTIRVAPDVRDGIAAELARVAPEWGTRIRLMAIDAMATGDARIAWDNGHAARDVAELWNSVVARLAPVGLLDDAATRSFAREAEHV